jgi:hypothetical protein
VGNEFPWSCFDDSRERSLQRRDHCNSSVRNSVARGAQPSCPHLKDGSKAQVTARNAHENERTWPSIKAFEFRGAEWSLSNNAQGFAVSIHIMLTHWSVSWFQKDVWSRLKQRWAQHQIYVSLPLGNTFMVIYERGNKGAQVRRPLCSNNAVDAEVLRRNVQYQVHSRKRRAKISDVCQLTQLTSIQSDKSSPRAANTSTVLFQPLLHTRRH